MIEVSAKAPKVEKEATVTYDFGGDLTGAVEKFGDQAVYDGFVANSVVTLQSGIRRCLESGRDPQQFANAYKPGVKTTGIAVNPLEAAKAALASMDPEARKEFLNELKAASK